MRMRPKKNRDKRMEKVEHLFVKQNENGVVDLENSFSFESELFLEIGCGKGRFVCGKGERYENINFIKKY